MTKKWIGTLPTIKLVEKVSMAKPVDLRIVREEGETYEDFYLKAWRKQIEFASALEAQKYKELYTKKTESKSSGGKKKKAEEPPPIVEPPPNIE